MSVLRGAAAGGFGPTRSGSAAPIGVQRQRGHSRTLAQPGLPSQIYRPESTDRRRTEPIAQLRRQRPHVDGVVGGAVSPA